MAFQDVKMLRAVGETTARNCRGIEQQLARETLKNEPENCDETTLTIAFMSSSPGETSPRCPGELTERFYRHPTIRFRSMKLSTARKVQTFLTMRIQRANDGSAFLAEERLEHGSALGQGSRLTSHSRRMRCSR
jgi:hypothetical protein